MEKFFSRYIVLFSLAGATGMVLVAVWLGGGFSKMLGNEFPSRFGLRFVLPVEDRGGYVRSQFEACLGQRQGWWRSPCYQELAELLSKQFSFGESLTALEKIQNVQGIDSQCHVLVHFLAQNEFKRTKSAPDTFNQCQIVCGEGCYHGTVEAYLQEKELGGADEEKIQESIAGICESVKADGRAAIYSHCIHGIGHAFMLITAMDVPKSLELCELTDQKERDQCYSGVLMENSFGASDPIHPSRFIKTDDPTYPCTILKEKYKEICYGGQTAFVLGLARGDWRSVAEFCKSIPLDYRLTCFSSMGANSVVRFSEDFPALRDICDLAPAGEARSSCIQGQVQFLAYGHGGEVEKFVGFCRSVGVQEQQSCFIQLGAVIAGWSSKDFIKKCEDISQNSNELAWCTAGVEEK